ncbi:competence protein CoiA family protein (plasmid) [Sphingomonas zeae]
MKDPTPRELAIRFVLDRHDRHHDVATLHLRDINAQPDGRHAFRCAACREPVTTRAGSIRRPFFAHYPADDTTPPCPWRTDIAPAAFHERNPSGDDGKWHIDAQCEIMTVLEAMNCNPVRNTAVQTPEGLRKPDIAVTIDGQLAHFEIQASPTDAWCAARRTGRDFHHRAVTLWIVSADAFLSALDHDNVPTWVDTLASMGGGQIWLWNTECYTRSLRTGQLSPLRYSIDHPGELHPATLPEQLPRIFPFFARLDHNGRIRLACPALSAALPQIADRLSHLADVLKAELQTIADRLNQTFRYDYGFACLNIPSPTFSILDGEQRANLRSWFERQPPDTLAIE